MLLQEAGLISGCVPAVFFQPGIVVFSVVDAVIQDRAFGNAPADSPVGKLFLTAAILILDIKLYQYLGLSGPSGAQHETDHVVFGQQIFGHVIGGIEYCLRAVGGSRI